MNLFNTCLKFKHDGKNQAQHKAGTKKVQGNAIAMSALVQLAQN